MSGSFDDLCDNTLAHVLGFADFNSAVRIARLTSASLSRRCRSFEHIWRQVFQRHLFRGSLDEGVDSVQEISKRRQYFDRLVGKRNRKSSFNLPNRYFNFVPVFPDFDEDADEIAPPVDFDCPSFALTTATSGEMAFLDPFDGSLVVQECCTDSAVVSDEMMMYSAMTDAATIIHQKSSLGLSDVPEQDIAGAIIEESVYRNHNMEHFKVAPAQVLLDIQDYFSLQIEHYFRRDSMADDDEIELDVGVGIEAKPTPSGDTMVALGRTLVNDSREWGEPIIVTEMIAFLLGQEQRLVCRFRSGYACMDIDPMFNRLYVVFPLGEGPFARMDSPDEPDERFDVVFGGRIIAVYPFEEWEEDEPAEIRHFPRPLFCLQCRNAVSSLSVNGDKVLVATTDGTIEIWKTLKEPGTVRIGILDVRMRLKRAEERLKSTLRQEPELVSKDEVVPIDSETNEMEPTPLLASDVLREAVHIVEDDQQQNTGVMEEDETPGLGFDFIVNSFYMPSHLAVEDSGFVSLHHRHGKTSSILLWKLVGGAFEVVSLVNLPISVRRKPRIHYDGRRLVIFGQDHIGMILLIYHVLSTWEDAADFSESDTSGGVQNFTETPFLRFANRIRHAGLGGLEYYDSAYMTCNERYVVVNTKTGNLLGGGAAATTDGLLVIDLEDYCQ